MISKVGTTGQNGLPTEMDLLKTSKSAMQKKLNALSYLPQIIAEKEYEARQYKEKAANYEAAHMRLHRQFANAIRSSTTPVTRCPKCGYQGENGAVQNTSTSRGLIGQDPNQITVKLQSRGAQVARHASEKFPDLDEADEGYRPVNKIQCDGEAIYPPRRPGVLAGSAHKSPVAADQADFLPSAAPEIKSPRKSSPESQGKPDDATGTSWKKPTDVKPSIDFRKGFFTAPEVSKKMFDKLVSENARMKQVLLKLEEQKGFDVHNFLSCQEYERVIARLRDELRQAQYNAEELQHFVLLQSKGNQRSLTQKLVDMNQKNAQITRENIANKQMSEAYLDAYEKIKTELAQLQAKVKDYGSCDLPKSVDQDIDKDIKKTPRTTSEEKVTPEEPSLKEVQLEAQLSQLQEQVAGEKQRSEFDKRILEHKLEDAQLNLTKLTQDCAKLQETNENLTESLQNALSEPVRHSIDAPESLQQAVQEKQQLADENGILKHDLKTVLEEKQILNMQLQLFNEDYTNFQADYNKRGKIIQDQKASIARLEQELKHERQGRVTCQKKINDLEEKNSTLQRVHLDPKTSSLRSGDSGFSSGGSSYQSSHRGQDGGYDSATRYDSGQRASDLIYPIEEHKYSSIGSHQQPDVSSGLRRHGDRSGRSLPGSDSLSSGPSTRSSTYSSGYGSSYGSGCSSDEALAASCKSPATYVCERCEEEFKIFELEKFVEHKEKCQI